MRKALALMILWIAAVAVLSLATFAIWTWPSEFLTAIVSIVISLGTCCVIGGACLSVQWAWQEIRS